VSAIFRRDRVTIMGVLNATPDSFSDGGRIVRAGDAIDEGAAVDAAAALARGGAHVLDVGGESTRPGAEEVAIDREIARTARLIEMLAKRFELVLSIDTRKAQVAEAALGAGAALVNDVSGLRFDPELAGVVARARAELLICHSRGTPRTMQADPRYGDVVAEVGDELAAAVLRAEAAGIPREQLAVDPGIGFGKRMQDNLALLANAGSLRDRLELPLVVGPSRKSFLGTLTGDPPGSRDVASHAACAVAIFAGADAVRVHDAAGAARAVAVARALRDARRAGGPTP
jgi:dihydropteroate synthase